MYHRKMDNIDFLRDLVKTYKQRRILWDGKHPEFYNKGKREAVWQEFATELDIPVIELRKKIQSLTGSYRREKSRIRRSHGSGGDGGDFYTSKWFAFKWFKFLDKEEVPDSVEEGVAEQVSPNTDILMEPRESAPSILRKRIVAKRHNPSKESQPFPEELKRLPINRDDEDEFDAFGRNVALQLKQLPLIHALESQELIQRVLKEQRIKVLRDQMYQGIEGISNDDNYSVTIVDNCTLSASLDKQRRDPLSFCNISDPGPSELTKSEPTEW